MTRSERICGAHLVGDDCTSLVVELQGQAIVLQRQDRDERLLGALRFDEPEELRRLGLLIEDALLVLRERGRRTW